MEPTDAQWLSLVEQGKQYIDKKNMDIGFRAPMQVLDSILDNAWKLSDILYVYVGACRD